MVYLDLLEGALTIFGFSVAAMIIKLISIPFKVVEQANIYDHIPSFEARMLAYFLVMIMFYLVALLSGLAAWGAVHLYDERYYISNNDAVISGLVIFFVLMGLFYWKCFSYLERHICRFSAWFGDKFGRFAEYLRSLD